MRTLAAIAMLLLAAGGAPAARLIPTPIGAGPRFHPSASSTYVEQRMSVGSLRCTSSQVARFGVHLELFAHGRVIVVPAGIGVAPPFKREGAYVRAGLCSYPLRTREPTGVIEIQRAADLTLSDFFAVWHKELGARRLLGFRTTGNRPLRAYVNGRRYHGPPESIRLRRHAEIVLEVGTYIPPHTSFRFRGGL